MAASRRIFLDLGFEVWHIPGISRAWKREYGDGSFLLITDVSGYDLPEPEGPWSGIYLSHLDEVIELAPHAMRMREIVRWILHTKRLCERRTQGLPVGPPVELPQNPGSREAATTPETNDIGSGVDLPK